MFRAFLGVFAVLFVLIPKELRAEIGYTDFLLPPLADTSAPIRVAIWYPVSGGSEAAIHRGPFTFLAVEKSAPAPGDHHLVVISHGSAASPFTHAHTAVALAQAGYVVAAPLHAGDNFQDASGASTRATIAGRAKEITAVIDRVTQPNPLGIEVTDSRISVIGYSAGGATALALAGAVPRLSQVHSHCAQAGSDPFCDIVGSDQVRFADDTPILGLADSRVSAVVVMEPVTAWFDSGTLAAIEPPVLILSGNRGDALSPQANAGRLAAALKQGYVSFTGAGHYSFLPVFDATASAGLPPAITTDAQGFDRGAFHAKLHHTIAEFLAQNGQ